MQVLIVDDHALFADSLALVLRRTGIDKVVICDGGGIQDDALLDLNPDVVLIDDEIQKGSTGRVVGEFAERSPDTRVIVMMNQPLRAGRSRDHGVAGHISKHMPLSDLLDEITPPERPRCSRGIGLVASSSRRGRMDGRRDHRISRREREVLRLLMAGMSGQQVATQLGISPNTVRSHIQSALVKLDARSRAEAVVTAVHLGILVPVEAVNAHG